MSMIEEILQQMQGVPTQQVADQLGVDSNQANGAIAAALPMLIGARLATMLKAAEQMLCLAPWVTTSNHCQAAVWVICWARF